MLGEIEPWILLALGAPLFWAFSNVIDQFLVRDSFSTSPTAYILFQGLFYVPLLVALYLLRPEVMALDAGTISLILLVSPCWVVNAVLYVHALTRDDGSITVPLYNMTTFFTITLAWVFLGESMSWREILAGCVIIGGAVMLMWDFKLMKFKGITFALMFAACWCYAIFGTFARAQTQNIDWMDFYFWYVFGFTLISFAGTAALPRARTLFVAVWNQPSKKAFTLSFLQAVCDFMAMLMVVAAYSAGKSAGHVSFFSCIQPLYVVLVSGIFGIFMPRMFEPLQANRALFWKLFCIGIMLFGVYSLTVIT